MKPVGLPAGFCFFTAAVLDVLKGESRLTILFEGLLSLLTSLFDGLLGAAFPVVSMGVSPGCKAGLGNGPSDRALVDDGAADAVVSGVASGVFTAEDVSATGAAGASCSAAGAGALLEHWAKNSEPANSIGKNFLEIILKK